MRSIITVKDFGPINRAKVELRDLNIFAGPSNTGKSFLAMVLYVLHRTYSPTPNEHQDRLGIQKLNSHIDEITAYWSTDTQQAIEAPSKELVSDLSLIVSQHLMDRSFIPNLCRYFDVSEPKLLRRHNGSVTRLRWETDRIRFDHTVADRSGLAIEYLPNVQSLSGVLIDVLEESRIQYDKVFQEGLFQRPLHFVWDVIASSLYRRVIGPISKDSFYLPADRGGLLLSHRTIMGMLVSTSAEEVRSRSRIASGVMSDFWIETTSAVSTARALLSVDGRFSKPFEKLLGGSVVVDSETSSFGYIPDGWDSALSLTQVSSMVTEILPLVMCLKYHPPRGGLLVIEEPEAHLHPEMQVRLMKEIAGLAKVGIRVVLTTHSSWILEALANLLIVKDRNGRLKLDQVGVWEFEPTPDGSTIHEVPLNFRTGTFPTSFDKVSESLYNEWAAASDDEAE